jgi:homoaconitate hydratase
MYAYRHGLRPMSIFEKIVSSYCNRPCFVGDVAIIKPAYVMSHDNTSAIIKKFKAKSIQKIHDSNQIKFIMDHDIQNKSTINLNKYKMIEEFAREHDIQYFPPETGIGHQVMCEQGFVRPNTIVVASDSHSNMYGGLGAIGTPIVRTDAVDVWQTGQTWWKIPPIVKVRFENSHKMPKFTTAKDIILKLIQLYPSAVLNKAIEFDNYDSLTIDDRLTIANMTTEWGAIAGIFPCDNTTIQWLMNNDNFLKQQEQKQIQLSNQPINEHTHNLIENELFQSSIDYKTDGNYEYDSIITLDLSTVYPTITGPNHVAKQLTSTKTIPINKGFIMSCVNGRLSDIESVANEFKSQNKRVHSNCELYIAAASKYIENQAKQMGYWKIFEQANCKFLPSGCGACIGLGEGILQDGDVAISATNRNYKGRMGSRNASVYLASPLTVVRSCIDGFITIPNVETASSISSITNRNTCQPKEFPTNSSKLKNITGILVFLDDDNISTDSIYAGKHTYKDLTLQEQANVVFENYDANLRNNLPDEFIIVTKHNFGTGSSREQAVTALQARGCKAIVANSFSNTYLRNAYNNKLICTTYSNQSEIDFNEFQNKQVTIDFVHNKICCENKLLIAIDPINDIGQQLLMKN